MSILERLGLLRRSAHVETARMTDVDRLAAIHAQSFAKPWVAEDFAACLTDPAIVVDGLYLGRQSEPSGFVVTRVTLDEAEVLSVALDRTARGEGHSRHLLASHLARLARLGVVDVHLEVEQGNRPALALYRGHGFTQSGTRIGYYARPDGTRTDALSMKKTFGGPRPSPAAW